MSILLLIIDIALIYGTFLLSYMIRYSGSIPPESIAPFNESYLILIGIVMASLTYAGAFRRRRSRIR